MKAQWTRQAINDRASIFDYLLDKNPQAALSIDRTFEQAAIQHGRFPYSGRTGLVAGTRELLPHPSYRLVYEVTENQLIILAVVHTSRLWPQPDGD